MGRETSEILMEKLTILASMASEKLVINVTPNQQFGVDIAIGASSYLAHTLNSESLSSALLHLSTQVAARMMNEETSENQEEAAETTQS